MSIWQGSLYYSLYFSVHLKFFIMKTKIDVILSKLHFENNVIINFLANVFVTCFDFMWKQKTVRTSRFIQYLCLTSQGCRLDMRPVSCSSLFSVVIFPEGVPTSLKTTLKFLWLSWTLCYKLAFHILDVFI